MRCFSNAYSVRETINDLNSNKVNDLRAKPTQKVTGVQDELLYLSRGAL